MIKQLIIRILSILFPIEKKKLLFFSYYGSQYGCNPKYLSEYMVKNNPELKIIWVFTKPEKYNIEGVQIVKINSFNYFYHLATSKIIITNYRLTTDFIKREGQFYIQTWHSSLRLKTIEKDAESLLSKAYIAQAKLDSSKIDLLISGCDFSTQIFENSFWYDGEVLEVGSPRIDPLLNNDSYRINKIKDALKIPIDNKIVLYAPTFREDKAFAGYFTEFELLKEELSKNFTGNWSVLVKLHPHLIGLSDNIIDSKNCIDVTSYDDIQELLVISDFLISDYSSLIFDFAYTKKPVLLYVPDLNSYLLKERKLYFDIESLPFIVVKNIEGLKNRLHDFDIVTYNKTVSIFLDSVGSKEDGKASKKITDYLINKI